MVILMMMKMDIIVMMVRMVRMMVRHRRHAKSNTCSPSHSSKLGSSSLESQKSESALKNIYFKVNQLSYNTGEILAKHKQSKNDFLLQEKINKEYPLCLCSAVPQSK